MKVNVESRPIGLASSNPAKLAYATDRLADEHEQLRRQLRSLEASAKEVSWIDDTAEGMHILQDLRLKAAHFEEELERHAAWEEQELYPFLINYFHSQQAPTIMPSFWVLEKDHQLGVSFLHSFKEAVVDITPIFNKKQLTETASYLLQACLILNDHLTMEEQFVLPLTDRVLMDLESFFS
ncbi:hemerythrin domain-containing protein [Paenibacillus sp. CGMCC 1.16610]|uniref:Hemerythrin-like domain-containing protein n=1 Tax=Paenibacillus anseongense TaxID=2682845 RepID=A0ABW9U5R1_9BACL|nr:MULTISPECIES: hemerythrin domain-containing protein [Paenibacillus]MBA2942613.1 hemerythrin domain-containing protein [Paenibacillus sp. CGMCC 1.16610]MVQ35427.1 hypothetical protein [Paenibacillus anseongense]